MIFDIKKDLEEIERIEKTQRVKNQEEDSLLPMIHIMPPTGWLNDPNGLCQHGGVHHIYFQYSPYEAKGGDKYWGHYETRDFLHYTYTGVFLLPDSAADKDGVYSGSALVDEDNMFFYYTGNVKEEGDFDYIYEGRGANTILVTSRDGIEPSQKQVILTGKDYPDRLSCHVRDPKVWKKDNKYYMVLGARTKEDKGTVLLYESENKYDWSFVKYVETEEKFGYMWECPDMFELGGKKFLSVSPQGLTGEEFCYQNTYQSGYFQCDDDLEIVPGSFVEWDMGFDFYAPQTYADEKNRRILIGWMGVPDASYDHDPSIEKGWQHMLTIPRELSFCEETGRIMQWPAEELLELREQKTLHTISPDKESFVIGNLPEFYELTAEDISGENDFSISFDCDLELSYSSADKIMILRYYDRGFGRDIRKIKMADSLTDLRIFVDSCALEIFINRGAYTMTTKYFYEKALSRRTAVTAKNVALSGSCLKLNIYKLKPLDINIRENIEK